MKRLFELYLKVSSTLVLHILDHTVLILNNMLGWDQTLDEIVVAADRCSGGVRGA